MKNKATIIALIILLALGAYVYYFERTPIEEDELGNKKIVLFPKFDPKNISEFSITGLDTTQNILCTRNKDSTWSMKSPVTAKCDSLDVETYLSDFKDLKSDRVLNENLQSLSTYGLATPSFAVILKSNTKETEKKLSVGNQTPDGNSYYVQKDSEPGIYLIASSQVSKWKRTSYDFRDKTVAVFDSEKVSQLTLTSPTQSLVFKKDNNEWNLTQPKSMDIDRYKIDDILWKIHNAQIKQFVDESPKDFKQYGLDKPALNALIQTSEGKQFTLALSDKGPKPDLIYGKTSDKSFVFAIETTVAQVLQIPNLDSIRNRDVFHFIPDDIQSLQLVSATTFNLVKEKDDWYLTTPKKTKADFSKIEDILWKINGLRIKDFVEDTPKDLNKYGLSNPPIKATVTDKNKKSYTLFLGNITKTDDSIYAKTDQKSFVFSLDTDIQSYIKPSPKDLIAVDTTQGKKK